MKIDVRTGDYDDIADEYYDPQLHPTCANFGELSERLIKNVLSAFDLTSQRILEVGCGRSIVGPVLKERSLDHQRLTLLDLSPKMLSFSEEWKRNGASLVVDNAVESGLSPSDYNLIIASLGDPYNSSKFWIEVYRLLAPGGTCIFTTPSREWAERFRVSGDLLEAEFLRADGSFIKVPSRIPAISEQFQWIEEAGLRIGPVDDLPARAISGRLSPKLLVDNSSLDSPVVTSFVALKLQFSEQA